MSDPNEDFAKTVAAAMDQEEGAPAADAEGKNEPAGDDPILEYAKALKDAGVAPEQARDLTQRLASMQTPQGQLDMYNNFIRSDAGKNLKAQFGQEVLADMLARDPASVVRLAESMGYKAQAAIPDDEDATPESRKIRAMEAQQAALEASIKQLRDGASSEIRDLRSKLQGREEAENRVGAFVEYARSQPPMAAQARNMVARRANELAVIDPGKYSGYEGFKRAARDAHAEYTNAAQYFQPKPRPRSTTGGGGGVAGKGVENGKMSLADLIEATASDFERAARNED